MKSTTHLAGGLAFASFVSLFCPTDAIGQLALGAIVGALSPDVDIGADKASYLQNLPARVDTLVRRLSRRHRRKPWFRILTFTVQPFLCVFAVGVKLWAYFLRALVAVLNLKHRGALHSPYVAICLTVLAVTKIMIVALFPPPWQGLSWSFVTGLAVGWWSHILLDALTISGRFGRVTGIRTGSFEDRFLGVILFVVALALQAFRTENRPWMSGF